MFTPLPFSFWTWYLLVASFFFIFGACFLIDIFQPRKSIKQRIKMLTPPNDNCVNKKSFNFYFLFSVWIVLAIAEIAKIYLVIASDYIKPVWFGGDISYFLPLQLCSLPLYFIPLYLFSKKRSEFYLLMLQSSLFISTFFLLLGMDVHSDATTLEGVHGFFYHIILCIVYFYTLLFNTRIYSTKEIKKYLLVYGLYLLFTFYICEIAAIFNVTLHFIAFSFSTPFSALFPDSYIIPNIIMLPLTFLFFVGSFYATRGLNMLNALIMKQRVKHTRFFFR